MKSYLNKISGFFFVFQKPVIVLLFLLAGFFQTDSLAGSFTVLKNGTTYNFNWDNTSYTTDGNGYLTSPGSWNYNNSISNQDPTKSYWIYYGAYQGSHCYWNNFNYYPFSWYTYKINNTEGMVVALLEADNANAFNSLWGTDNAAILGVAPDGGPLENDAGGHTRISYNYAFSFSGMRDAIVIFVPWSQVFSGSHVLNLGNSTSGDLSAPLLGTDPSDPLACPAEPVDTGNGSHFMNLSLLKVHGAQDLEFTVDYNSISHSNDLLGPGWSHNFETRLQTLTNGSIQVNWNSKRANVFLPLANNTNAFTCPDLPVVYDTLALKTNGSYSLMEPSQRHLEFDNLGRLQKVVNPHGQPIQLVYQSTNAYPTQIVELVSGKSLYLTYNTSNLLAKAFDDLGRSVSFSYDSSNRLAQFVKSFGTVFQTNKFSYDTVGHILTETNANGTCVFIDTYDSLGRVIAQQDAKGGNTTFSYDESQANRIITTVVDRTGATNIYVHDKNYLVLSITDPLSHTTSYVNDAYGNKVAITNALGKTQFFSYDSFGNQITNTDAAGQTTKSQWKAELPHNQLHTKLTTGNSPVE